MKKYCTPNFIFKRPKFSLHTSDILLNHAIHGALAEQYEEDGWDPKTQEEFDVEVDRIHKAVEQMMNDLLDHAESIGRGEY